VQKHSRLQQAYNQATRQELGQISEGTTANASDAKDFAVNIDTTKIVLTQDCGPTGEWEFDTYRSDADKCKRNAMLKKAVEWRTQEEGYRGADISFNCVGVLSRRIFDARGKCPDAKACTTALTGAANKCYNGVQLQATGGTKFTAKTILLNSTHKSFLCMEKKSHLVVRISSTTDAKEELGSSSSTMDTSGRRRKGSNAADEAKWLLYSHAQTGFDFPCDLDAKACTLNLEPPIEASSIRLQMYCKGGESSAKVTKCGFKEETSGADLQLRVHISTAMSSFSWDNEVKTEISSVLDDSYPKISCGPLLNASSVVSHFEGWKTNQIGLFSQDPPVGSVVSVGAPGKVWNATASKKVLATPGESVIEKRMLCFESHTHARECCVSKQLLNNATQMADHTAAMATARLQNF